MFLEFVDLNCKVFNDSFNDLVSIANAHIKRKIIKELVDRSKEN